MTDSEKELLIRIDERTKDILEALARDYKCLHGNGQPGLIERVQTLEATKNEFAGKIEAHEKKIEALEKVPARVQTLENYHTNENSFLRKFGAVIAWIATTALALYSVLKHH
jgi:methionine synthase II (cobalamin-independent)